jgi:two-component system, chemotaxis family, sensor kinase CheA
MPSGELRREVEDLALRLVVGGPEGANAAAWIPALERICELAQREQAAGASTAAACLLENLRGDAVPEAALQEGIATLQKALDDSAAPRPADRTLAQDPELISDFIVESREHLANIETQVLTLEREPTNSESLNAVFRGFHTIKGLAGFLEVWEVQKLAHEVETVLDRARNSQWTITGTAIDVILESSDYLRRWLAHLESLLQQRPSEPPGRDEGLLSRIVLLSSEPDSGAPDLSAMAAALTAEPVTPQPPVAPIAAAQPEPATPAQPAARAEHRETMAVKVDTAKLDYLVDMAGEMVIAESLVRHDQELAAIKNPFLHRKIAHMTRITAELQKTAMSMRLVPMGPLFRRMARLVRDLSRQFGKQVEMETQGDDIELDRTIVEELADPLMHMVRNALDHGIELPADRESAGKRATARLLLKAQHQAGQVVIEITDDGRGLDRGRIQERAVQKGLVQATDTLTDNEVFNLIFEPGFTTAAQVTNVSGRGVGMDVVRRHIEKLRGRIEIRSEQGRGATFLLKLPLTLAIIEGLVVSVGAERYIVPLFAVREMFRPTSETLWTVQQRAEMALVRGKLLPVVRLYRVFNVEPGHEDPCQGVLVVAEVEGQQFCLLVDALIGKQEVVIKSLGDTFKNVSGVAGGAILGDGRVGLILDLDRLLKDKNSESPR